jgi:hypothetical protein
VSFFTYRVTGCGDFPIDMLRYDECQGIAREDIKAIAHITDVAKSSTRTISIEGANPPTVARWESFGWSVTPPNRHTGPYRPHVMKSDIPETAAAVW